MKVKGVIASGLLLFLAISSQSTIVEGNQVTGKTDSQFKPNTGIIPPVDPDDEDDTLIETEKPLKPGPLSINYASDIRFGKQKITKSQHQFLALDDVITQKVSRKKREVPNFVQVTDLRGSAGGWTLSVKQNGQLKNKDGVELTGSQLTIQVSDVKSQHGQLEVAPKETTQKVLLPEGKEFQEIFKATKGTGMGRWNIWLGAKDTKEKNVSLTIPKQKELKSGHYNTSLTWLLSDGL